MGSEKACKVHRLAKLLPSTRRSACWAFRVPPGRGRLGRIGRLNSCRLKFVGFLRPWMPLHFLETLLQAQLLQTQPLASSGVLVRAGLVDAPLVAEALFAAFPQTSTDTCALSCVPYAKTHASTRRTSLGLRGRPCAQSSPSR